MDLQKQADNNSYQYAQAALGAQAKDRDASCTHQLATRKTTYLFIFALVVIIAGLMAYAIGSGNQAIAMEIIKAIIFLVSGGSGGYALAKSKQGNNAQKQEAQDD
ncbi:MAG: hypothetical protein ACYDAI_02505 [Trichloromonadaceae bacterium]